MKVVNLRFHNKMCGLFGGALLLHDCIGNDNYPCWPKGPWPPMDLECPSKASYVTYIDPSHEFKSARFGQLVVYTTNEQALSSQVL
jgi:hypothetical protein